jgi:anti-sigma regulatory factor (Ser/Thr protein kinase)
VHDGDQYDLAEYGSTVKGRYRMGMPAQDVSPPGDTAQWPYHSFLPLGALPGAVPCARLHTTAVLWEWGMESLVQAAELAVSELVTNAVRASIQARSASPPSSPTGLPVVGLRLAGDRQRLLVEVSDHDPGPPVPTAVDPERDGGRGLLLVEAVSERWGYYYPATDAVPPQRTPALAASAPQFLAAPPLLPAAPEPGKIVWALLFPSRSAPQSSSGTDAP